MDAIAFFTVVGNLASAPEAIKGGCRFTIMNNTSWTDDRGNKVEQTHAFRITCFGKLADSVMQYTDKGDRIEVYNGKLSTSQRPVNTVNGEGQIVEQKWTMIDLLVGPGTQVRFSSKSRRDHDAANDDNAGDYAQAASTGSSRKSRSRSNAAPNTDLNDDIPF